MLLPEPVIDLVFRSAILPICALFKLDADYLALVRVPIAVKLELAAIDAGELILESTDD